MKLTIEEIIALANINAEMQEILQTSPWVESIYPDTDVGKLRIIQLKEERDIIPFDANPTYTETDIEIPARDGVSITMRIHKPKNPPKDGCPIFVVYHGGGFCFSGLDNATPFCRNFTRLGGIAVNVDYRLAPEHPFPTPIYDALDSLRWTATNFESLGGNPKKGFLVGGVSAGGDFAAVLALMARDEKLSPPLTGVYLSAIGFTSPVPEKYKQFYLSLEQNKDAPLLSQSSIAIYLKHYGANLKSPLYTPMIYESHKNLPPTYFQVCGLDPLRDDGLIYERMLSEDSGVKTKIDIYPGLPHAFWGVWRDAKFTQQHQLDSVDGIRWLLDQAK